MAEEKSPFVEDAKVARRTEPRFGESGQWRVAIVDRVYKNGRFILRGGDKQQWRPREPDSWYPHWYARQAGEGSPYSVREALIIWDASTEAMIEKDNAAYSHRYRLAGLKSRVEKMNPADIAPEVLVQIVELLPPEN